MKSPSVPTRVALNFAFANRTQTGRRQQADVLWLAAAVLRPIGEILSISPVLFRIPKRQFVLIIVSSKMLKPVSVI